MNRDRIFIRPDMSKIVRFVSDGDIINGVSMLDSIKCHGVITVKEHYYSCTMKYIDREVTGNLEELDGDYCIIRSNDNIIRSRYDTLILDKNIELESYIVSIKEKSKVSYLSKYIKWYPKIRIFVQDSHGLVIKFSANIISVFKNCITGSIVLQSGKYNYSVTNLKYINPGVTIMKIKEESLGIKLYTVIDIININIYDQSANIGAIFKSSFSIPKCDVELITEDYDKRTVALEYIDEDELIVLRLNKSKDVMYSLEWDDQGSVSIFLNCISFTKVQVAICMGTSIGASYNPRPQYIGKNNIIWYGICDRNCKIENVWKTINFV